MKELEQTRHINQIGAPFIKHLSSREVVQVKAEVGTLDGTESVLRDLKKKISHITPIMIGKVGFMLSVENTKNNSLQITMAFFYWSKAIFLLSMNSLR